MNTTESNKLIAEFLGFKYYPQNETWTDVNYELPNSVFTPIDDNSHDTLFFHDSWDWLMPVVQKIRATNDGLLVERIDIMPNDGVSIHICGLQSIIVDVCRSEGVLSTIEAMYKAVVEFIKWYNKNQ